MKKILLLSLFSVLLSTLVLAQVKDETIKEKEKKVKEEHLSNKPEKTLRSGNLVFKSLDYDFGKVEYASDKKGVFEFKNVSKKPAKITNVQTFCGCTGADWPREEIKKKSKGKIIISYDTKRVGKFNKSVMVYIEGATEPLQLRISGEVMPQNTNNTDTEKKQ